MASTLNSSPSTEMASPCAVMSRSRLPSTESYFSRCASVRASVMSLTATKSMLSSSSAARMMLRPMRPKPLIPTLMAIANVPRPLRPARVRRAPGKRFIVYGASCEGSNAPLYSDLVSPFMYFLYSVLVLGFFVVVSPWFLYQAIRYRKYIGSLSQRMGYLPVSFNMDAEQSIWIHAVSVGEVLTARPLARDLRARYPRLRVFLSTTTMTGQALARRSVPDVDEVFYFPFDLGIFVRRTLDLVAPASVRDDGDRDLAQPAARVPAPRRQDGDRQRPALAALVSALSDGARLHARVLDDIDSFCVQSEQSARRFIDLGANPGASP